ncbi:Transglutaminase-like superfamily protein [Asanoa hainanensis]|uniref:Transglutaminase-like superfamily protein n=1 Tax=Asanoa hainanensis TaxID=560556 RepID=A0A239N594_9ACTN|nr:Transglutaminase-like superfamily protein [Asanoa hainanensis]
METCGGHTVAVNAATAILAYDVTETATIAVQVAVAGSAEQESLSATVDGTAVEVASIAETDDPLNGPTQLVSARAGRLLLTYTMERNGTGAAAPAPNLRDRIQAVLPSRYCPSDRLTGYAARFRGGGDLATVQRIVAEVHDSLVYDGAASGPTTDAVDTLLAGRGVCRDYAHLTVALCRAVDVPARVVAVYAPGLSPMDFHLVAETAVDGAWLVWDATRLAPRSSLLRVSTGRDAADVAFGTVLTGAATLTDLTVTAVADGALPDDDHECPVILGAHAETQG